MEKRIQALQVKKAIWIKENGMRKFCDVTINKAGSQSIDLLLKHENHPECTGKLLSEDNGFSFRGKISSSFLEYIIALRCFISDKDVLFFGDWYQNELSGELAIHANIQHLIISDKTGKISSFAPVA